MPGGDGGTPLYGLYRYVQAQRGGFSGILVITRVLILAILVLKKVWFFALVLNWVFLRRSYSFIIINKTINKSPS